MKLILEDENLNVESQVVESVNEATGQKKKEYFLTGVFSTAGVKNGNGRVYPREIWEREVALYQSKIEESHIHTLGEWEHPARADVDPMKAVIKITELKLDGDYVYGKAKVLDNPEGERLKVLIDEGIKIDISSRGVGSVGKNGVVEEFKLITYDLVSKASNPGSHLTGIVEGQSYMINESGDILPVGEEAHNDILVEEDTSDDKNNIVDDNLETMSMDDIIKALDGNNIEYVTVTENDNKEYTIVTNKSTKLVTEWKQFEEAVYSTLTESGWDEKEVTIFLESNSEIKEEDINNTLVEEFKKIFQ